MNEDMIKKFDKEVYISVDIEADGPYPGGYSMLNLGAASFKTTNPNPLEPISTFSINIKPLEGAGRDPSTMSFWEGNQQIWFEINENQVEPQIAMDEFRKWIREQPGTPAFVGYPGGWDFMFVYYYLMRFGHDSPFSFRTLSIATYACAMLKTPFRRTVKRSMPKYWFDKTLKHTHLGVDDAIGQGVQFMNMLCENLK